MTKTIRQFVIARCDTAEPLYALEKTLYNIAVLIESLIVIPRLFGL